MSTINDKYKVSNYETLSEKTRRNRFRWKKFSINKILGIEELPKEDEDINDKK